MTYLKDYLKAHRKSEKLITDAYTADQLRDVCKGYGIKATGTKQALARRLIQLGHPL